MWMAWIGAMSVVAFGTAGWDKHCAVRGKRRVPEARLLGLGLLGGSPGLVAGMLFFRHKTSKTSFRLAAGAIVLVQIGFGLWYVWGR